MKRDYVMQRLANLLLTPEKYNEDDLHNIKNVICFLYDCQDYGQEHDKGWKEDFDLAEDLLKKYVYCREMGIPITFKQLNIAFGTT